MGQTPESCQPIKDSEAIRKAHGIFVQPVGIVYTRQCGKRRSVRFICETYPPRGETES